MYVVTKYNFHICLECMGFSVGRMASWINEKSLANRSWID